MKSLPSEVENVLLHLPQDIVDFLQRKELPKSTSVLDEAESHSTDDEREEEEEPPAGRSL